MTIMPNQTESDNPIAKTCERFFKRFNINRILRNTNAVKENGVPAHELFAFLIGLVFSHKNLYMLLSASPEQMVFGKDTVYRFLNRASINWNRFVRSLACAVVPEIDKLTSAERRTALVIDDSPFYRNRSKKVELLSRCYDHAKKQFYKGFILLALGWTDGQTFLPVDFRLVASHNDKNLYNGPAGTQDRRTLAARRRMDARKDKPSLALEMLRDAKSTAAQARYVLFDSWFASPLSLRSVNALGYDVVARLKNTENHRYGHQGQSLSIRQIYAIHKKRRGMSRYLLSEIVDIPHKSCPGTIPAKLVYVRDRTNRKKWIALISTDTTLTEEEIVALYGKRWDIEVFFKLTKNYLRLAKEFQSRSYDAMVAHTAVVFARYMLLAHEHRENRDDRTFGPLFYAVCKELEDISFAYVLGELFRIIKETLTEQNVFHSNRINELVGYFINALPPGLRDSVSLLMCES